MAKTKDQELYKIIESTLSELDELQAECFELSKKIEKLSIALYDATMKIKRK